MAETALISIGADLTELRRALADIPNLSNKSMQATLIAVEKTVQKAEKASKAAIAATAKASKAAASEAQKAAAEAQKAQREGLKGLAEFAGLDVGPIEKLGEATKLLSTTGGAIVGVAGGVAVMFAGIAASVYGLVTAAIELNDKMTKLDELSADVSFPPEYATSVSAASDSLTVLKGQTDILVYTLGAELAPYLGWVVNGLIDMVKWVGTSGEFFSGLASILKMVASVYLQNMIDVLTFGVQRFMEIVGVVGKLASVLGMQELGASLTSASDSFDEFISTLGSKAVNFGFDNTIAGAHGIVTSFNLSADANKRLADALKAAGDTAKLTSADIKKLADEAERAAKAAADATEKLKDMATTSELDKLVRTLEKELQTIKELEIASGNAALAEAARVAAQQKYADGVKKYNEELAKQAEEKEKLIADEQVMWNKLGSTLEGLSANFKYGEIIAGAAKIKDSFKGMIDGGSIKEGLSGLKDGLKTFAAGAAEAVVGPVMGSMTDIMASKGGFDIKSITSVDGILNLAADAALSGKKADEFGENIAKQAGKFVNGLVTAIPGLIDGLVGELPYLFSKMAAAIPELVGAVAEAAPRILFAIIGALPELIIAIIAAIPRIITGLVKGFAKAIPDFILYMVEIIQKAFSRAKQYIKDIFKEIVTFGKGKTETFGDTPGPIRAGADGLKAVFAPGDHVVAAKSENGLKAQLGGMEMTQMAPIYATLDIRDGALPFDKIIKRNIRTGGSLYGERSGRRR